MKRAVLMILLGLGGLVAGPAPVAVGHAQVTGTFPEDGAVVDSPPEYVAVDFEAKPVTAEGEPLVVYAADGRRVDAGDVRIDDEATMLVVSLSSSAGSLPAGHYDVVYRVVSADTHLIVGRFGFESRHAAGTGNAGHRLFAASASRTEPVSGCAGCRTWPAAVAAVGLAAAATGSIARRWRSAPVRAVPAPRHLRTRSTPGW